MYSRRRFLAVTALALPGIAHGRTGRFNGLPAAFAALEAANGGRLGVFVLDAGSGERAGHRADERFPMCSTFKFLLASAILRRSDRKLESLERAVGIPQQPLLFNSPLTEPNAGGTMSVAALCAAILTRSDNTAANLLLEAIGGPSAMTRFCRAIGDGRTRLDRTELELNESRDGDPRDTTTPRAMVGNLDAVLLGRVLSRPSRDRLTQWMEANVTGLDRLRAGLPAGWRAADKTGANGEHTSNDIAVLWPPGGAPIVIAAYLTQCEGPEAKRASVLARVGELVRESVS